MIERLLGWLAKRAGATVPELHQIRGFRVVVENTRPDISTEFVLKRLDESLALIERWQPFRFRHLQRDLLRFAVVRHPTRGAYIPADRTCLTELTFLARAEFSPAQIAASIVHEGMHARVHRATKGPQDRAREERACRRAELDFGKALPAEMAGPVIERAEWSLALPDAGVAPAIDWQVAERRQRVIDIQASDLPDETKRQLIAKEMKRVPEPEEG